MKPISADEVSEALYNFLQLAFSGAASPAKTPFEKKHADAVMMRITSSAAFPIKDAMSLPDGQRRAFSELLTQYVMFLTMFRSLVFPPDFLQGTDETRLGSAVLRYFSKHGWPFPQQLPWSGKPAAD